ncbi:MAG TPA: HAD-IIB family hydrolase [Longimicrobiales bacterium]|nr:HAD-IIB family hydrolase [Longimicrobiales bacterium]
MSEVNRKLSRVGSKSISRAAAAKLLASDLDGTLIPPPNHPNDGGVAELRQALERARGVAVAYVTGRSRLLALEGIRRHELPPPALLVCDVGTSVFVVEDGEYVPDPGYRELMLEALGGAEPAGARDLLAQLEGLELQEEHSQTEFKLSYYTPADARGEELAALAREVLAGAGRFNVVHSVDPHVRRGLLDVLPAGVAKDVAVRYLHDRSGVPEHALVYAGDSGNDLAAMLSGFNVVVVGNATAALKETIRREAEARGIAERVHFAEAWYAAGVLEGCRRFGIL